MDPQEEKTLKLFRLASIALLSVCSVALGQSSDKPVKMAALVGVVRHDMFERGVNPPRNSHLVQSRQVRALLSGSNGHTATSRGPARKRVMSAEARKRIGDAQRKRWAAQKKAAKKAA
jgi:hypothetical protein